MRIEEDFACFTLTVNAQVVWRFSLDINGFIDENHPPYALDVQTDEHLDLDPNLDENLSKALVEATPIAREQLEAWQGYTASEKIQLQILWAEELMTSLVSAMRRAVNESSVLQNLDFIGGRLRDIEFVHGRIDSLRDALSYL